YARFLRHGLVATGSLAHRRNPCRHVASFWHGSQQNASTPFRTRHQAYKPNFVRRCRRDGHSSRPCIAAWLKRPTRRLGAPSRSAWRLAAQLPPYLVLLRVGFAVPRALLRERCALTAPFHPYLGPKA